MDVDKLQCHGKSQFENLFNKFMNEYILKIEKIFGSQIFREKVKIQFNDIDISYMASE